MISNLQMHYWVLIKYNIELGEKLKEDFIPIIFGIKIISSNLFYVQTMNMYFKIDMFQISLD